MTKLDKIFLDNIVPVRLIQKPYCIRCCNQVRKSEKLCSNCLFPPSIVDDWFFNRIIALGIYHQFENIPINTLSELILMLKFRKQVAFKDYAASLIADGLIYLIKQNHELFENSKYIICSPKYDKSEKNQCLYILEPLIKKMEKIGYHILDISGKAERVRDVGKNKLKTLEQRFNDIQGVHKVSINNLNENKVIILDDIITTGSTVWDLARALREKNAGEINVLAVGRHWLFDKWPIPELLNYGNLSFNDLMFYFSNLEYHRNKFNIMNVKIKKLNIADAEIYAEFEGTDYYFLLLDLLNKRIKHNCTDFLINQAKSKKFCKHISKLFIEIMNKKGVEYTKTILNLIYKNLDDWVFEDIE